jgi:quaternary ammonium compound-resistance protein SugE
MSWIILLLAGIMEVTMTFCLGKLRGTAGAEFYAWGTAFLLASVASMVLLAKAVQTLPIGTAYAVWTGIGAVGTVTIGILVFKEPVTFARMFFLTTLICSIVGLKIFGE